MGQKGEVSRKQKSLLLCRWPKKAGRQEQWCDLAASHPPFGIIFTWGQITRRAKLASKLLLILRATKGVWGGGGREVKGQAKHLEKPKSSLGLTTGHPFTTNAGFQIRLPPTGASPHLRNSVTHPCLLPRHCEDKKAN